MCPIHGTAIVGSTGDVLSYSPSVGSAGVMPTSLQAPAPSQPHKIVGPDGRSIWVIR
jgi:hypothetical protein